MSEEVTESTSGEVEVVETESGEKLEVKGVEEIQVSGEFITQERIWALVRALCILASSVATLFGYSIDADLWFNAITTVLMVVSISWGYWKNNNWSELANLAQGVLNQLRKTVKTDEAEEA